MPKAKKSLKKKDLKAIEKDLLEERDGLVRQIEDLESNGGEAGPLEGGDPADIGSDTVEREQHISLVRQLRNLLAQVEDALERIEAGTYGTCESCGEPIESARLKALPHASLCISCKRSEERRY